MTDKDTGGPAFPQANDRVVASLSIEKSKGITLRDYFAAKAMQALIEKYNHEGDVSRNAYRIADAMLEARER